MTRPEKPAAERRVQCHACGQEVPPGETQRGFLINEKARLGARVVELEGMLGRATTPNYRNALVSSIANTRAELEQVTRTLDDEGGG